MEIISIKYVDFYTGTVCIKSWLWFFSVAMSWPILTATNFTKNYDSSVYTIVLEFWDQELSFKSNLELLVVGGGGGLSDIEKTSGNV